MYLIFYARNTSYQLLLSTTATVQMQKSLQKLKDEITCPICQDTFDNPKILSCGHCYCKRCVLQLAARKQPFPCPECRRDTFLPPGPSGVDEFPTAFFINRMKSLHDDLDHVESPDKKAEAEVATRAHQQSCVDKCVHVDRTVVYGTVFD